jgi:transcriptional regulator with AAA-type ATPase domain
MSLLSSAEWAAARAIAGIGYVNPFLPERIELERRALGDQFVDFHPFVQFRPDATAEEMFPNAPALHDRGEQLLEKMRRRLVEGEAAGEQELLVYEDLALLVLYYRYMSNLVFTIVQYKQRREAVIVDFWEDYRRDFQYLFQLPERRLPSNLDPAFAFAGLFQIQRAFYHIFGYIIGGSLAAARLRAAIWQSIFSHDMRRYARVLHRVMGNVTTLITGPSGTGKELVARAIAFSRFIAFDPKNRRFAADYTTCFHGLNLSALPATLIESELFGHVKGAFTGANKDHAGHLDEKACRPWDTVFLDEIGDVDQQIQVKLLRVLENREFQRVGDVRVRRFAGKILAATNRDLATEMDAGRFREDFYYRLCADRITTPSLREQLGHTPHDLPNFVRFIANQLLPELEEEAEKLTQQCVSWIDTELGPDYTWPGNIRELEQCVRSIMIRGTYSPTRRGRRTNGPPSALQEFLADVQAGRLQREELLKTYFSLVYSQCGSYRAASRRLGTDWRTVQRMVDTDLVQRFAAEQP